MMFVLIMGQALITSVVVTIAFMTPTPITVGCAVFCGLNFAFSLSMWRNA